MSLMRLAVGLTIWFSAVTTVILILMLSRVEVPESFVMLPVLASMTWWLLPVRWALILALLLRTVREKPLARLPQARGIQVAIVVVVQLVLGMLSVIGVILVWTDSSKIGDRIAGFVFHACLPLLMLLFLARRATKLDPGSRAVPAAP